MGARGLVELEALALTSLGVGVSRGRAGSTALGSGTELFAGCKALGGVGLLAAGLFAAAKSAKVIRRVVGGAGAE